jgi:DNA-binding NarL/FixJ family response regulator
LQDIAPIQYRCNIPLSLSSLNARGFAQRVVKEDLIFHKRRHEMGAQNFGESYSQTVALQSAFMVKAYPSMAKEPNALLGIAYRFPVRVLIASEHALFREGLRLSLAQQEDMQVIGEAADGPQTLRLAEALQPDILLLDIQKPIAGELELLSDIRARSLRTHVLILAGVLEDTFIAAALRQGAMGYLLKTATQRDLVKAVHAIYAGELWVQRKVLTAVLEHMRQMIRELQGLPLELQETLTDREREVVTWVMQGMTNKEIATQLDISEKTVKTHLRNIFLKLKVSRRAQLFCALHRAITF